MRRSFDIYIERVMCNRMNRQGAEIVLRNNATGGYLGKAAHEAGRSALTCTVGGDEREMRDGIASRALNHAALSSTTRLTIIDLLIDDSRALSEIAAHLRIKSNLLAHHLNASDYAVNRSR